MAKELTVVGSVVSLQDLMIEKNAAGVEKKVAKCEIEGGLYKSEVEAAGLDFKVVTEVNKFNHDYINRVTEEAVKAGTNILAENKEADRVVFAAPYLGEDLTSRTSRVEIVVDRSKTITIPGKGQEERPAYSVNVVNKFENIKGATATALKQLMQDELAKN